MKQGLSNLISGSLQFVNCFLSSYFTGNSHSNGNTVAEEKPDIAKEQETNGATAAIVKDDNEKIEAKVSEQTQPNGELENGVVSLHILFILELVFCKS